ncbi:MAG: alpha/beta fold hydrolase [Sedimenticola sp.]|nr:alpha/beta fold hydrolase [Sedimenticola sp.]
MSYIATSLLALAALALLLLAALHLGFRAPRNREQSTPADRGIAYEAVSIPTFAGKRLAGWLLPVAGNDSSVIILHGWGGNAELMLPMALPFHRAGINVLLIDARNHGQSDGDTFSSLPRFAEDLEHAVAWLRQQHPQRCQHLALLGHSVGAGAALLCASRTSDLDAVISVSAFAHPEWMMKRYLRPLHLPGPLLNLVLHYVQWVIGHRFSDIAPLHTVCRIHCPILLVHGTADTTVPVEDARAIAEGCPEATLQLIEIPEAAHDSVERIEQHGQELVQFLVRHGFSGGTSQPA